MGTYQDRTSNLQPMVYDWLLANPGHKNTQEVAEGLGLDIKQAGNALTNLKKRGAAETSGRDGMMSLWFALPGYDFDKKKSDSEPVYGTQRLSYDWLIHNPGEYSAAEIATATGLKEAQVSGALTNLKRKGAVTKNGDSIYTKWSAVPGADLGAQPAVTGSTRKGASPGAIALQQFKKSLEVFLDAAVAIQDYIVVEDQREELERLRAFKAQVDAAMRAK
jgi:predicted transcriptional regulator